MLVAPVDAPPWFMAWMSKLNEELQTAAMAGRLIRRFTVADLPNAAEWESANVTLGYTRLIYVADETGGATIAFSDGTNWRRCQDRAIVS